MVALCPKAAKRLEEGKGGGGNDRIVTSHGNPLKQPNSANITMYISALRLHIHTHKHTYHTHTHIHTHIPHNGIPCRVACSHQAQCQQHNVGGKKLDVRVVSKITTREPGMSIVRIYIYMQIHISLL